MASLPISDSPGEILGPQDQLRPQGCLAKASRAGWGSRADQKTISAVQLTRTRAKGRPECCSNHQEQQWTFMACHLQRNTARCQIKVRTVVGCV